MKMLEGIKVLDFTTNASGPKAGTYFADYGAEVVKVEVPGGEGGRKFAFYVNGISTYACGKDRGKKSVEIKLSDPDAQKLLLDVVKDYDVLISSNKPGFLELGVSPEQAPDTPTYITLHFEKGIPTAVDGKEMGAVELVEYLNKLGGANGIGLLDIVENRLVGMKSRGVYETPGGAILYKAIDVLETITLDKESAHFKAQLAQKYADIVYNGQWFTPLREALDAFADSLEKTVTGDVKLKLYKGNMINAGVTSPFTLYDEQTASFGVDKDYDQSDATGFINLFGLSIKERAKLSKNWPEVK